MIVADPLVQIGWTGDDTYSKDPRVPVTCDWCLGTRIVLERMELGMSWEHLPIVCPRCKGVGSYRIERRRGMR